MNLKYTPQRMLRAELVRQLCSSNNDVFWLACEKLELLAGKYLLDKRLIHGLIENLKHCKAWRRSMAALVMKRFPCEAFVKPLHQALQREEKENINPKKDCLTTDDFLEALDAIGARSSIPVFRRYLDHSDDLIQHTAIIALTDYSGGLPFSVLEKKLETGTDIVRLAAIRGLYQICIQKRDNIKPTLTLARKHLYCKVPDNMSYDEFINENRIVNEIREIQCRFGGQQAAMSALIENSGNKHFGIRSSACSALLNLCNRNNAKRILNVLRKRQHTEKIHWFRIELMEKIEAIESKINF